MIRLNMIRLNIILIIFINFFMGCKHSKVEPQLELDPESMSMIEFNDSLYIKILSENILNLEADILYISLLNDNSKKNIELFNDISSSRKQLSDWLDAEEIGYNQGKKITEDSYLDFNDGLDIYYEKCNKILFNSAIGFKPQKIKQDTTKMFKKNRMILKKEIFDFEYITLKKLVLNVDTTYLSPRVLRLRPTFQN